MSMIAKYVALTEADLNAVCAEPSLAEGLFLMSRHSGLSASEFARKSRLFTQERVARMLPQLDAKHKALLETQIKMLTGMPLDEFLASADPSEPPYGNDNATAGRITPRAELSLEKAWHGVHYLLCGRAEEAPGDLAKAVMGGRALGGDPEGFSGYGPARYFKPVDVDVIAAALNDPSVAKNAAARFDPDRMEELHIYPGWDDEDEDKDWVMDALRDLCGFYANASRDRLAVVTCIV